MLDALPIMRRRPLPRGRDARGAGGRAVAGPRARPQHRRPQGPDRRLPGRRGRGRRDDRDARRALRSAALHGLRAGQRRGRRAARDRRAGDGAARVPMDGGGEIVVGVSVDAAAGEAVLDFTGVQRSAGLQLQRPLLDRRRRRALCVPLPGGRRHSAQRRLPRAAEDHGRGAARCSIRSRRRRWWPATSRPASTSSMRCSRALGVMANSPGHDEQLHLRRRDAAVLRDHLRRRRRDGARGRRQRRPHPHDQLAPHRSGDPGAPLSGAAGGVSRFAAAPAAPACIAAATARGGGIRFLGHGGGAAVHAP